MPVFRLTKQLVFPPPELAEESGLLAVGGDLSAKRLLLAYQLGIFPWFNEGDPILWHSPDPRMVLEVDNLVVNRSLRKTMRRAPYVITFDKAFSKVMRACAEPRGESRGTWITPGMLRAYGRLHRLGYAHSVEAWQGRALVGGLYGVSIGGMFFGESMFARAADASKVAFVTLCEQLARWDIRLIDCQQNTEHLARFGAKEWSRERFLRALGRALEQPTRQGRWSRAPSADRDRDDDDDGDGDGDTTAEG